MSVRVVTCNMFKKLGDKQSGLLIAEVSARADVILWQEVTSTHKQNIKAMVGWSHYFSDGMRGLAISWRTNKLVVEREGKTRVVVPGDGEGDPARGFIDIVLRERATGTSWPLICCHLTHQAWTSAPWRRARWLLQAYRLWRRTRRLKRRHGRCVGGGDVNKDRWTPKGTVGHWPPEGTFGGANYDVIWTKGAVRRTGAVVAIHTPGDHDAVTAPFDRA